MAPYSERGLKKVKIFPKEVGLKAASDGWMRFDQNLKLSSTSASYLTGRRITQRSGTRCFIAIGAFGWRRLLIIN